MAIDTTNEELLGSQRGAAKKICGSTIINIKRLFNFYKKHFCPRSVQVNNLNVYLNLTVEEEKIEQLIMEYNNHLKSHE